MALLNYSLPYAAPAPPPPYLGGIQGYNNAPAVNSLFYNRGPPAPTQPQHLGGRQTYHIQPPPPAPSRTTATTPRRLSNDPYRNQQPPPPTQQKPQAANRQQSYYTNDGYRSNSGTPTKQGAYPTNPPGYTRISEYPSETAKTSLHAVLDYDDDFDDYNYDDEDVSEIPPEYRHTPLPAVTPIQGPIFIKNNSVPVVPLFSHPVLNNGSLVQIPILWTALSVALGLEIRGEIIRGVPCIKRFHQLFCPTAGNSYPIDRIDRFIDDNKALMKRMYGEFQMSTEYGPPSRETYGDPGKRTVKRDAPDDAGGKRRGRKATPPGDTFQASGAPEPAADAEASHDSYFSKMRQTRQSFRNNQSESGRVDACESKVEITTPYWASNSAGKIRAIVNTQHFEQAIHQEVCSSKLQTKRCSGDCGCEQKYKWHRLLAYDPDNDCKGIFMDWFLFPSCCVCRCAPLFGAQ